MKPFEKLLLRRARNSDLQRSAQWLANLVYAGGTMSDDLIDSLEYYGSYAETEDPEQLMNAEAEIGRALRSTVETQSEEEAAR